MRDFKYTPQACDGKILEGYVIWNLPSYIERRMLLKSIGVKFNSSGNVEAADIDHFELLKQLHEECHKYIKEVCIENKMTTEMHTSFESVTYDPYCDSLIEELAFFLINGVKLGKN